MRNTPSSPHVFDRGGDKWTNRPIGDGNGMTAAALLPAAEAGGAFCADNRQGRLQTGVSRCHLTQAAAPFSLSLSADFLVWVDSENCSCLVPLRKVKENTERWVVSRRLFAINAVLITFSAGTSAHQDAVSFARLRDSPAGCHVRLSVHAKTHGGDCLARSSSWEFRVR